MAEYKTESGKRPAESQPMLAGQENEVAELFQRIAEFASSRRFDDAIKACDAVVRRISHSEDGLMITSVTLAAKSGFLVAAGLQKEAVEVCDELVRRFGDIRVAMVPVALALLKKGEALRALDHQEEAVKVYDEMVRRCAGTESLLAWVAEALKGKGSALGNLGHFELAIEAFDDALRRFANAKDPSVAQVADALLGKGAAVGALGRYEEAIGIFDDVARRFGEAEGLRGPVATALTSKSWLFYRYGAGRLEEAIDAGERAVVLDPEALHRHTLASVYALASRWDEAFEQILFLIDDEAFLETYLDDMLGLLIDAAANGQAERALRALAGTATERAMEPLVVALKELTGEKYRAPQEIEEVKKDVLARIEERRRTLREQRAKLRDS